MAEYVNEDDDYGYDDYDPGEYEEDPTMYNKINHDVKRNKI